MVKGGSALYLKRTDKFWLELPMMFNNAHATDKKNVNTLWQNAIQKDMENVKIEFQTIPEGKKPHNGFQYVNCHRVFDIKMEDFHRSSGRRPYD